MLAKLGAIIGIFSEKRALTGLAAVACGLLFGALEYAIMRGFGRSGLPVQSQDSIDAAIIGLGTGAFAWILLCANRARRRRVRQEIDRIAELNHEIRNALQVIADTQYVSEIENRALVLQSVSRIDAVLKRLCPIVGSGRLRDALARHHDQVQPTSGNTVLKCTDGGLAQPEAKRAART